MVPHAVVGPDRWRLGFREAVLRSFGFLEDCGLAPVVQGPTLVRYESGNAFINIYHGRASFELGVETGRPNCPDERFGLGAIMELVAPDEEVFGGGTATTHEAVERFVAAFAKRLERYLKALLALGPAAFDQLKRIDTARRQRYWHDQASKTARSAAEAARVTKDYAALVHAYELIESELTELEKKRLAYARSRLERTG